MYIFSKNFRGSPDGWSNLLEANFLIGENSTGKSSYGKLIKIIWSTEFQYSNSCILQKYSTSEFGDYFSRISDDKNDVRSFTIGFLSPDNTNESGKLNPNTTPTGKIISYVEKDGDIKISRMSIMVGGLITSLEYANNKLMRNKISYSKRFGLDGLCKKFSELHFSKLDNTSWKAMQLPHKDRPPEHVWNMLGAIEEDKLRSGEQVEIQSFVLGTTGMLRHLGPIRQRPERVYFVGTEMNDPEGRGSLNRMKRSFSNKTFKKAMDKFGIESRMFDEFKVVDLSKHVEKNAFTIKFKRNGEDFYTDELGFGVSQIIPLLVEMMIRKKRPIILIEQPELHLHPKAQAAFGELLYQFSKSGSTFIVETHSDFIIDRFRMSLAKDKIEEKEKINSQVIFFSSGKNKNTSTCIPILPDGNYANPPRAYRQFFLNEELMKFNAL